MSNKLLLFFLIIVLVGCVSNSPMPVASHNVSKPYDEVVALLYSQAKSCWEQGPGLFRDRVVVGASVRSEKPKIAAIFARHYTGYIDTFIRIEVYEIENNELRLDISESQIEREKFNYSADVKEWLDGKFDCIKR